MKYKVIYHHLIPNRFNFKAYAEIFFVSFILAYVYSAIFIDFSSSLSDQVKYNMHKNDILTKVDNK